MKKKLSLILIICSFLTFANDENEEQSAPSTTKKNKINFSTNFTTSSVQKGKAAEKTMYILSPTISFKHKTGFSISAASDIMLNASKKKRFNDVSGKIGYSHIFGESFLSLVNYSYTKYYSEDQVISVAPHKGMFLFSYLSDFISPTISTDCMYGDSFDYSVSLDLSHSFDFENIFHSDDSFSIPLSISSSAGTSKFYNDYKLKQRELKGITGKFKEAKESFSLNSLSIQSGISYSIGIFSFDTNISYIVPIDNFSFDFKQKPSFSITLFCTL